MNLQADNLIEIIGDRGEAGSVFPRLGRWRKTPHEVAQAIIAGDRFYVDAGYRIYLKPVSPRVLLGLWSVRTECGLDLASERLGLLDNVELALNRS